jgi:hypothetical protein
MVGRLITGQGGRAANYPLRDGYDSTSSQAIVGNVGRHDCEAGRLKRTNDRTITCSRLPNALRQLLSLDVQ